MAVAQVDPEGDGKGEMLLCPGEEGAVALAVVLRDLPVEAEIDLPAHAGAHRPVLRVHLLPDVLGTDIHAEPPE